MEERDFPGSALINKGKGNLTIVLLLAVFVIIELSLFRLHSFPLTRGETDGIGYMDRATGPLFQAHPFHGPGYSTAIRAIQSIGVAPFASAKVISLVFGMVFILSTWLILRSFSSSPESFLATTFVAFSPVTLVRSATILSDMMAASLFLATLALLVVPRETKAWHFALAGLVAGLAYLTRYIYILLVAVPLIYMAFWIRGQSRRSFALIRMGVFYLGFVVITLPWFIFLWKTKGNPLWNENYLNIAFKMHQHARGWNVFPSSEQYRGLLDLVFSDTLLFLRSWMRTIYDLPWLMVGLIPRVGFMASAGFFFWLARFSRRKGVLVVTGALYGLAVSLVWVENRFLIPVMPLVGAFVASCVFAIPSTMTVSGASKRAADFVQRIPLRLITATILLVLLVFISAGQVPDYFNDQPIEYRAAAEWLAHQAEGKVKVMASKPHISFFSKSLDLGFRTQGLQNVSIEDLPDILAGADPTYFIYDERYGASEFPELRAFLEPDGNPYPDLLIPVLVIDSPRRLVLYKYERP